MSDGNLYELKRTIQRAGITRAKAAELLHVSPHTVDAWLKPGTSRSANPVPMWAIELLEFKTGRLFVKRDQHRPEAA